MGRPLLAETEAVDIPWARDPTRRVPLVAEARRRLLRPEVRDAVAPRAVQTADAPPIPDTVRTPVRPLVAEEADANAVNGVLPPEADLARMPLPVGPVTEARLVRLAAAVLGGGSRGTPLALLTTGGVRFLPATRHLDEGRLLQTEVTSRKDAIRAVMAGRGAAVDTETTPTPVHVVDRLSA